MAITATQHVPQEIYLFRIIGRKNHKSWVCRMGFGWSTTFLRIDALFLSVSFCVTDHYCYLTPSNFTALHACRPSGYPAAQLSSSRARNSRTDQSIPQFENNTPSDPCLGIGSVLFGTNCVCCVFTGGWDCTEKTSSDNLASLAGIRPTRPT